MKLSVIREIFKRFPPPTSQEEAQKFQEILRAEGIDFRNVYQELEMTSCFVDSHQDVSFSNAQVSLHSHTFY